VRKSLPLDPILNQLNPVRFQVLTAASMKKASSVESNLPVRNQLL
jgi:hypothetical protein